MIKQEFKKIYNKQPELEDILNVPGNAGDKPEIFNDPQVRLQKWGGNLMGVYNGHPIDIESDLKNVGRKLSKYCKKIVSQTNRFILIQTIMLLQIKY